MIQSATPPIRCYSPLSLPLDATFDAPRLTSDGGLVWVAEADDRLGLCSALAAAIPDWRTSSVTHPLVLLLRQRVFQIACGYEDQDDADSLRTDPLFKLVCGRLPADPDLASQPTFSRLENAIDFKTCYRLAQVLLAVYLQERGRSGPPTRILIDADSTDDPTHGDQEGSAYHGFYEQHMLHPLLLTDGETDEPITAVLRPGTCHAGRGIVAVLKRVVSAIRARFPGVVIEFRGDSGFAIRQLYDYLDAEHISYAIALIPNTRLRPLAEERLAEAKAEHERTGEKVRLFGEARYAADSWATERRVVYKTEWLAKGPNVRFVVTNRTEEPEALYTWYVQRGGSPERCIKDLKHGCFLDRLSDHAFWANQFRLFLHIAVYWLLHTVRRWLIRQRVARMQLDTLRLLLIKIGGWLRFRQTQIHLHLAASHPGEPLWLLLALRPNRQ
jgi:Transposase DDE domain group 1